MLDISTLSIKQRCKKLNDGWRRPEKRFYPNTTHNTRNEEESLGALSFVMFS